MIHKLSKTQSFVNLQKKKIACIDYVRLSHTRNFESQELIFFIKWFFFFF